ncbi:hypothetical protein Taro_014912 [Colocasia esculenta]|uniref:protein disulfide-isomerase n=1 Tax=Colocasia esculenta TaxID=4460 RepID=A0A843UA90_COLES|nr:hypothetical protein [Colocasia esculenta]
MFFLDFSGENFEAFKSAYHDIARNSKGKKISFLMGDLNASERAFEVIFFGLKNDQAPLIIVQTSTGKKKFLKTNVEPTHIAAWIKDYLGGNVQPYRRSEPIPEVNNEPVKVVVGDSFNDIVSGSGKNAKFQPPWVVHEFLGAGSTQIGRYDICSYVAVFLIEFYAPWCGHCKKLEPILDEVAISLQSDSNVVIAKLDATANDVPSDDFEIRGFPTLYFRTPSGKLAKYEGERTKEGIIAFIQENRDPAAVEAKPVKDEL